MSSFEHPAGPPLIDAANSRTWPANELALILDRIADGVTVQDGSGALVYVNTRAANVLGYPTSRAMLEAAPLEFLDRIEVLDEFGSPFPLGELPARKLLQGLPAPPAVVCWRERQTGLTHWSVVKSTAIYGDSGAVRMVINIFTDITPQKRVEQALRRSEEQFRMLVDSAPVMVWLTDSSGRYDYFNRAWLEFTGRTLEEERGDGWSRGIHPEDRSSYFAAFRAAFTERLSFRTTFRLRRADGEYRWILADGAPRWGFDDHFVGYVGSATDISEIRRAEESLALLNEAGDVLNRSLDLQETVTGLTRLAVPRLADWCAVDLLSPTGELERVSVAHADPRMIEFAFELDRRSPIAPDAAFGPSKVVRSGRAELCSVIQDRVVQEAVRDPADQEILRRIGLRSMIIVPLRTRDQVVGTLTLVTTGESRTFDEGDLALAEQLGQRAGTAIENARLFLAVQQSRLELEEQAGKLEATRERLEELNRALQAQTASAEAARREAETANLAKSEFLSIMSHELRTPLNAISGYVDLLALQLKGPLNADQQLFLRKIQTSERLLGGIVDDLLNFARIEAGRLDLQITRLAVQPLVQGAAELLAPQAFGELRLEIEKGLEEITVRADEDKVHQILLNLFVNAIKYAGTTGEIRVEWEETDRDVHIHVIDQGPGIPPHQLDSVFEPFVQGDRGLTRAQGGLGLGLPVSRGFARAMGGDIRLRSEVGVGSTFTLILPRA